MNLSINMVAIAVVVGIVAGILIDVKRAEGVQDVHFVQVAEAATSTPPEVRIEVVTDWTRERIEREIRDTFPEDPETAVKIAQCESGLRADIQSHHILSYGRERSWGVFQIHEPDHQKTAERLGLYNYKTDPRENIALARHIYDAAGGWTPWSCYTKRMI